MMPGPPNRCPSPTTSSRGSRGYSGPVRRGAIVGIVAGAVALVAAAGVTWWLLSRPPSAEDAARAYLDALTAGDAEAIAAMMPDDDAASTATDAFAGAVTYIEEPQLGDVQQDGDGLARATAAVTLGDEDRTVSFGLQEDDGRWMLTPDSLAELTVEATIPPRTSLAAVRVGDALVPTAAPILVLPAVYEVAATPAGIVAGSSTVAVSTDRPAQATVAASLSPDATARAQEQLDAYAAMCTEPASGVPEHCGIVVPWAADLAALDRIAFRVEQSPVVHLAEDASGFDATGGALVATVTGTTHDGTAGSFTYRTDEWALRGSMRFEGDDLLLLVR